MYNFYARAVQSILWIVFSIIPWPKPELLEGPNSTARLPKLIDSLGIGSVLIVTDQGISALGLMDPLLVELEKAGIAFHIYDKTVPNPTIDNIEEALVLYKTYRCLGLIAFGGGSSIDCAKGVACRVARPYKTVPQLKGLMKVHKKLPPLFAIPTTAGTGSETTVAAVVTNSLTHEKYPINDLSLIPRYAVLDPVITVGLPPHITATTGMDALTHAVEAYIGRSNTRETEEMARKAIKLIFENLYQAYVDGTNLTARDKMQKAAFYAGIAFTRAYVGYVHAVAHTLGGFYGVAHGLANAVILPYVLEKFGPSAHKRLAELADLVGITQPTDSDAQKAEKFIEAIKRMNREMGIPDKIEGKIQDQDIPLMAERANQEAYPLYPVPRIMRTSELAEIYHLIK